MLAQKANQPAAVGGFTAITPAQPLGRIESELIALFVQLAHALGQPRSYAEIYGLIFISPQPLTLEHVIQRLRISRGSASQGLKFLRDLGAIHIVNVPGERSLHYQPVARLRLLVTRFLQRQILPQFDTSRQRLNTIAALAKELTPAERAHVAARIHTLRTWANRTQRLMPFLLKLLEP